MGTTSKLQPIDSEGRDWEVSGDICFMLQLKTDPGPGTEKRLDISAILIQAIRSADSQHPWRDKGQPQGVRCITWEFHTDHIVPGVSCLLNIGPQKPLLKGQVLPYQRYLENLATVLAEDSNLKGVITGIRLDIKAESFLGHFPAPN